MKKGDIFILLAGALWGLTGLMFQLLAQGGISRMGAVAVRLGLAALGMLAVCLWREKRFPRMALRDLPYCAGAGILGFAMFNFSYFTTISLTSLSVAAAFLYTSPAFVIVLSRFLYKEPITKAKVLALVATVGGSALATGAVATVDNIGWAGLAMGLVTGFGYALYNLFSKAVLARNSPETVTFYTLLFGALATWILEPPASFLPHINTPFLVLAALAVSLLCCMLPSLLFSKGLSLSTPGRASILVASELVVASVIGFVQGDPLGPGQLLGLGLLLLAIAVVQRKPKKEGETEADTG